MLLLIAWLSLPAIARAQPTEVDKDAARALVQRGDERRKQGDYAGALGAYQEADQIMGVPTTSVEVGRMHLKLGQLMKAYQAFTRTVEHPPKAGEPEPFGRAREAAKVELKKLKKRIPRLTVEVVGVGTDVLPKVVIDGEPADGLTRRGLDPGKHEVVAAAEGYQSQSKTIELREGDDKSLLFELQPEKPADTPLPPPTTELPTFAMIAGGFGAAAVGVIIGAITGGVSLSKAGELADACHEDGSGLKACPKDLQGTKELATSLANASTAFFVIAAVGAGVGVTGLVLHDDGASSGGEGEAGARVDVTLSPLGAALRVTF